MGHDRQDFVPRSDCLPQRLGGFAHLGHVSERQNGTLDLTTIDQGPQLDLRGEARSVTAPQRGIGQRYGFAALERAGERRRRRVRTRPGQDQRIDVLPDDFPVSVVEQLATALVDGRGPTIHVDPDDAVRRGSHDSLALAAGPDGIVASGIHLADQAPEAPSDESYGQGRQQGQGNQPDSDVDLKRPGLAQLPRDPLSLRFQRAPQCRRRFESVFVQVPVVLDELEAELIDVDLFVEELGVVERPQGRRLIDIGEERTGRGRQALHKSAQVLPHLEEPVVETTVLFPVSGITRQDVALHGCELTSLQVPDLLHEALGGPQDIVVRVLEDLQLAPQ